MNNTPARTTETFATFVGSLKPNSQPNPASMLQVILGLKIADPQAHFSTPARRVHAYRIRSRRHYRKGMPMYKVVTLKDKSIPTRQQRRDRAEADITSQQIRAALVAGNASKAAQEDNRE